MIICSPSGLCYLYVIAVVKFIYKYGECSISKVIAVVKFSYKYGECSISKVP